jgi:hypothetical protein
MTEPYRQRILIAHKGRGKEIFEITPVALGGSPTDLSNKTLLSREEHIKAVVYWNRVLARIRAKTAKDMAQDNSARAGGPAF